MLINLRDILSIAEEKNIAIGSFNTPNLESLLAVIHSAEDLQVPVIVQFAQCHDEWLPLEDIGPIMLEQASKAKIPVCVHLDHGETLSYLAKALQLGFSSIMYDGSNLPYKENIANTKHAAIMAHAYGASIEAELGSMGRRESGSGDATGSKDETKIYTNPDDAAHFVKETCIDALACSFGTTHGIYLEKPRLDFNIVRQVRQKTNGIPVVMHGGSGVSEQDFQNAIQAGVRKINYFTYMDKAGGDSVTSFLKKSHTSEPHFYSAIRQAALNGMKENVRNALRIFSNLD